MGCGVCDWLIIKISILISLTSEGRAAVDEKFRFQIGKVFYLKTVLAIPFRIHPEHNFMDGGIISVLLCKEKYLDIDFPVSFTGRT